MRIEDVHEGQHVTLKANPDEGWSEERAVVLEVESDGSTIMVEIIPEDRDPDDPDGLREILVDQIKDETS